jgi:hypothetical protein
MSYGIIARRSLGVCVAIAAVFTVAPSASSAATSCSAPALVQAYSWAGDTNWYAALPGESWDSFGGTGWLLSGGAKIVSTTLADGKKGSLLDLPSGAKAVSPATCVTNDYPNVRTEVRNMLGSVGVNVSVAYMGTNTWGSPQASGTVTGIGTGWTLPKAIKIKPGNVTGWQLAQFTLVAAGSSSEYQISNLYVDPRMH